MTEARDPVSSAGRPPPPGRPRPGSAGLAARLAAPAAALAAAGGAFAYIGAVDPNRPGHYPACPLLRFTGLLCPGCGGLRAAHALAHGDPLTALGANAPAVAAGAVLAVCWLAWCVRRVRDRSAGRGRDGGAGSGRRTPRLRAVHGWVAGVLLLAFTVVRNLPLGSALAP